MELNYTPRSIAEIEDIKKKPITDVIGDFSMSNIALFVQKGMRVSEEKAFGEIEKYFEAGGDMVALYLTILEALQKKGFLPKALNIKELRAKMENLKF